MDIWIVEEKVTNKFIGDFGHYLRVDGELKNAYYLNATGEDYVENNKDFLLEFLLHENRYPLFVTFIVYDNQTDEYITFF